MYSELFVYFFITFLCVGGNCLMVCLCIFVDETLQR